MIHQCLLVQYSNLTTISSCPTFKTPLYLLHTTLFSSLWIAQLTPQFSTITKTSASIFPIILAMSFMELVLHSNSSIFCLIVLRLRAVLRLTTLWGIWVWIYWIVRITRPCIIRIISRALDRWIGCMGFGCLTVYRTPDADGARDPVGLAGLMLKLKECSAFARLPATMLPENVVIFLLFLSFNLKYRLILHDLFN